MKIQAAVIESKGQPFKIQELELKAPQANEVLVKMVACGVCHTDAGAQHGEFPAYYPIVLGHEGAGIVEKVGPGVTCIKEGDRVVLSQCFCGHCQPCYDGNPGGCLSNAQLQFGGKMEDGTTRLYRGDQPINCFFGQSSFATHVVTNQKNVIVIKDQDVDLALLGPLGCGFQTGSGTVLKGIRPEFGSTLAVFGCGGVGLTAIMGAKLSPCDTIIAVDVKENRLKLAKELGAKYVINGKTEDIAARIKEITNGMGVTYAIDAAGVGPLFKLALNCLSPSGKMVVIAVGHKEVALDVPGEILFPTRTVQGIVQGSVVSQSFIPKLVNFYKEGRFPLDKLITFFPFEKINEAFAASHSGEAIKPVLRIS